MPDREKVIKGLEHCSFGENRGCAGCPYNDECGDWGRDAGVGSLCTDALALLLEQEPVVFCGDCKYWNAGTCLNDNVSRQIEDCGCYPDFVTDSNWFCAEGERR